MNCSLHSKAAGEENQNRERKEQGNDDEQKQELKPKKTGFDLAKFVPNRLLKHLRGLGRPDAPPISLALYNERSGPHFDISNDIPLSVLVKEIPKNAKEEAKLLLEEVKNRKRTRWYFSPTLMPQKHDFAPQLYNDVYGAAHGESNIQYEFKTDMDMAKWNAGADSDWSEGYSKCELYRTDRGTAIFEGTLNKRVIKDGRTKRAGWCTMKSIDTLPLGFKLRYRWLDYTHVLVKCRGDGRSYKLMLHTPGLYDVTWGESYSYPLHTHGGPYWQYEKIPFSRFFQTVNGRIQDNQREVDQRNISSIGITVMDRIDGPFRLEMGFIGAVKHVSHTEEFAYEHYHFPLLHPEF